MAGSDDFDEENMGDWPHIEFTPEEDALQQADIKSGMSYFLDHYDQVIVVGWNEEAGRMDIAENTGDAAVLYELLQQAAANVALEAIETAFNTTRH